MRKLLKLFGSITFILFGVFSLPFSSEAQELIPFELRWRQGTLVLTNGDTLRGHTSIMFPNDIVRLTLADGTMENFTPGQIQMLEVKEPVGKTGDILQDRREYRQYIWNRDKDFGNFQAPALFMVVVSGKYGLMLREERLAQEKVGGDLLRMAVAHIAEQAVIEKYYIRMPDQKVKLLRNRKSDLLELFPDKKKAILKYARENNLEFNKLEELARIVAYCNSI